MAGQVLPPNIQPWHHNRGLVLKDSIMRCAYDDHCLTDSSDVVDIVKDDMIIKDNMIMIMMVSWTVG